MLRRGWIIFIIGATLIALGILLDRQSEIQDSELTFFVSSSLLALAAGALLTLLGCVMVCIKERATLLMLIGVAACGALPFLGGLMMRVVNVHSWTGMLLGVWFLAIFVAAMFLLVGFIRFLFRFLRRRSNHIV